MKQREIPIALNVVGGYLAEEGCPLIFLPLKPGLKVKFLKGRNGLFLENVEKFVNSERLESITNTLFQHVEERVGLEVVNVPYSIPTLGYESAILAALAEYSGVNSSLLQFIIEEKVKSAERGVIAGGAICSYARKPVAYRVSEGYVELEKGVQNMYLYIIGFDSVVSLNEIMTRVKKLKNEHSGVFEPLFHALCRLSIEVANSLRNGEIEKLSFMLSVGHRILSAGGLTSRQVDRIVWELEEKGVRGKLLEDVGQYIFTLTIEDLNSDLKSWFENLEVYAFHVV